MLQEILRANTWDRKLGCKRFNPFSQVHNCTMLLTALRFHILQEILNLCPWASLLCLDSNLDTLVDKVRHFHELGFTKPTCCKRWWPYPNSTRVDCTLISCDCEGPKLFTFLTIKNSLYNSQLLLAPFTRLPWRWHLLSGAMLWQWTSSWFSQLVEFCMNLRCKLTRNRVFVESDGC